jgi:hypothetical protein
MARRRRRSGGPALDSYLLSGAELPSTNTVSGSEAILWRYEISYCACGHKVLSDIVGLRDSTPVFLSGLNPLYFCTDDAEEAFPICIKDPGPRISGGRDVTNRSPRRSFGEVSQDDRKPPLIHRKDRQVDVAELAFL